VRSRNAIKSKEGPVSHRPEKARVERRARAPRPARGGAELPGSRNQNPTGITLLELLREDFETYGENPFEPGLWAVLVHRLGNARMDLRSRIARGPCTVAYLVAKRTVIWGFGIDLCYSVPLGRRVRLWHHGGMVLGARAIGDDVHIRQNTTFGVAHRFATDEKPIIGDRVDVGAGACVLGSVTVGHDAVIGANSVVVRDVPPHAVVLGVPARPVGSHVEAAREKRAERGLARKA
jgi:serine O-acetyltransferase